MKRLFGAQVAFYIVPSRRWHCLARSIVAVACLLCGESNLAQESKSKWPSTPIATLTGLVKSENGDPIAGAAVVNFSVEPASGKPLVSKFSDKDCLKYGFSDAAGRFTIKHVDGDRVFDFLVARKGYRARLITSVDARKGSLTVVLSSPVLKTIEAEENDVWGRAVDPDGKSVAGAIITPRGYMQGDTGLHGPMDEVAEVTITDQEGTYRIPSTKHVTALHLEVRARGFVPQYFNNVPSGLGNGTLTLVRGATLRGRVVYAGQPRSGIVIGVCWAEHLSGRWFGPWEAVTDDDGRFVIAHVTPDQQLCLYGKIDSVKEVGTVPAILVTAADQDDLDFGDIPIVPGHGLKGRVMISEGRPLPPHLHVRVYRDGPRDDTIAPIRADGVFELKSLPDEIIELGVQAIPPGQSQPQYPFPFHLSAKNRSLNPHNPQHLLGRLDADLEIKVLLEPGKFEFPEAPGTIAKADTLREKLNLLRGSRLQGLPAGATDD